MSEENPDIIPETPETENTDMENPDTPSVNEEEPEVPTSKSDTIFQYLSDISPLLTEGDIRTVLRKRHLDADTLLDDLEERDIDLAEAEAYYKLCDQPVGGQTVKDVDGSWSHSEGGWTVSKANIAMWYRKYANLREKWGEEVMAKRKIRIINL